MCKTIIPQARGKGGPRYRAPSFRYAGDTGIRGGIGNDGTPFTQGTITDLITSQGHHAPLMHVAYSNGITALLPAPEGIRVGDIVHAGKEEGKESQITPGSTLLLRDIPEGTQLYNVELRPGDGGTFCKTTGTTAKLLAKTETTASILLPSKKVKELNIFCRACIGFIAGGGRKEKPYLKAGVVVHARKTKNKLYPRSSAAKMNAVDHPFGNKRSSRKSKQKPVSRHAPPGRKVGKLAARRTGRRN